MLKPSDVRPGMPLASFTAEDYRSVLKAVREAREPKVAAPLEFVGDRITLARPEGFYATLSGSSSPYSFTEKYGTANGGWATRVRTGTTNAYEVNGVAGLDTKVAFLRPGAPGDYRFQWVTDGGGGCAGSVTLTFVCGGAGLSGVSVTITQGGTSYSGTTNGSGQVTFSPGLSGVWTFTATKTGYVTVNGSFTFACGALSATYGMASTSTSVSGNVIACGVNVVGATVTVSDASGVVATTTTDGSGNYTTGLIGHSGTTLTIAASGYRLATGTATRTVTCGSSATANFNLSAATGDRCLCSGKIGSASTLNFTSSGYSATLTYGTGPASGLGAYSGTFTASCRSITGGGCTKGTATVTFTVEFVPACSLVVYFNRVSTSGGTTVCTTPAVRVAPSSDAYCATLPAFPGGPECRLDTLGTNGDVPTLVSAVGGPISATPFVATFSGILFRDADDVAFLTDAVVSE